MAAPAYQPQPWAIDHLRVQHEEALYRFGEYAIFVLLWQPTDFDAGLVGRCPTCFESAQPQSHAFEQPARARCPDCLGTTFEGGYRAKIVRPAIFEYDDIQAEGDKRGTYSKADVNCETTWDFQATTADIVVRMDNTRWQVTKVTSSSVHTGFHSTARRSEVGTGWSYSAALLDPSSVAYTFPPVTEDDLRTLIDLSESGADFSAWEVIRAPLIVGNPVPTSVQDPPVDWGDLEGRPWDETVGWVGGNP